MNELMIKGEKAKQVSYHLSKMSINDKNKALEVVAKQLVAHTENILAANEKDISLAKQNGMKPSLVDRLLLTESRIKAMADGLLEIVQLEDPVGEVLSMKQRPNGLRIGQKRVPIGVIGIIYEARPNVTADAFGLCFKTGNAVLLRGGKDAIESNKGIVKAIKDGLEEAGVSKDAIQLVEDTSRETAVEMMKLNDYLDLLIPRGGASLIKSVIQNSTIPVIETGTGNCHIYVDKNADIQMANNIIVNAKTQRTGVCNAAESLVIHADIAKKALEQIIPSLKEKGVTIYGDERTRSFDQDIQAANEEDYGKEYLGLEISVKVVDTIDEAINHINKYNTKHSEAIITESYTSAQRFLDEVDAAAVYVNASTRFTDGSEFGFGAEIGISTQKLHARGPMGLQALTTTKYIIYGNGQIR